MLSTQRYCNRMQGISDIGGKERWGGGRSLSFIIMKTGVHSVLVLSATEKGVCKGGGGWVGDGQVRGFTAY